MVAMPSLPALDLSDPSDPKHARYYILAVSDTWPAKHVSHVENSRIKLSARASRRFIDNDVTGDLAGEEIELSDHECSLLASEQCTIGWVTRYETGDSSVTLIEVDGRVDRELALNEEARRDAYKLVRVGEQRLDMFSSPGEKMLGQDAFRGNWILSRLLLLDQTVSRLQYTNEHIDVRRYVHVAGSGQEGLGPVDETVFMKSLGSISAKNKVRSALAIGGKARLVQLREKHAIIRDVAWSEVPNLTSRLLRSGMDGIYVKTAVPMDSIAVLIATAAVAWLGGRALITTDGVQGVGEAVALGVAGTIGASVGYHKLRYKSWALSETVRLRRLCRSDEEMYDHMSGDEAVRTIAEGGAMGAGMDGILTCAFSGDKSGTFSVMQAVQLEAAARAGLKLRMNTSLEAVWVDVRGVRAVRVHGGMWHAHGPYLQESYLELSVFGPICIGAGPIAPVPPPPAQSALGCKLYSLLRRRFEL